MTTPHPDKALIDAITSGAAAELQDPLARIWRDSESINRALEHGAAYGWQNVRLKPADTHREKTVRYPVPMQVMPEGGVEFWAVAPAMINKTRWSGWEISLSYFNAGLCYEIHREADAREAWQARFGEGWK